MANERAPVVERWRYVPGHDWYIRVADGRVVTATMLAKAMPADDDHWLSAEATLDLLIEKKDDFMIKLIGAIEADEGEG